MLSFTLPQTELRGVLGSIVQLDGRSAQDSTGLPVTLSWSFTSVPIGSVLVPDLNTTNPASLVLIRPDRRAVSFIPDVLGVYVVQVSATNGTETITQTATIYIRLSLVPCAEGGIPDMQFIWQYLPNFYQLIEDREIFQVVWSSMIQILGAELTTLYSNNYNKSLKTIQPTVMRRWQRFSMRTDLASEPQSVILGNVTSGTSGESGPLLKSTNLMTRVFRASDSTFTNLDVNYRIQGRLLEIDGTGHEIVRAYQSDNALASLGSVFLVTGVVFTNVSTAVDTTSSNTAVWSANQDYVYVGKTTPFLSLNMVFSVVSSVDLSLTFEYSNGSTWTSFTPTDGTSGGTQSGDIVLGTLANWAPQAENGLTYYWVRIRRTTTSGSAPQATTIRCRVNHSVLVLQSETLANNLENQSYRLGHLLHTPNLDLQKAGVSAGDIVVLEVKRGDSELAADIQAQVLAVNGTRLTFEINVGSLAEGGLGLDLSLFEQLVQDLRVVSPSSSSAEITAVAKTFISFIPTGINTSNRPFSDYLFTIRAKEIIHNTRVAIDLKYQSIPALVHEITETPDTVFVENTNFTVSSGWLTFQPEVFSLANPSKAEYWAECCHIDNLEVVENNFGRVVGLTRDTLEEKQTRAPYLSAVKGLWYAITNGPNVSNLKLALHILMGLPFTEERGEVIVVDNNYGTDPLGVSLGRLLIEDVDVENQRLGIRRFYFFPTAIGLASNPATGENIQVGDILEAFIPLSGGITIEDIYSNSTWWIQNLRGQELRKFFTFSAQIETTSGIFNESDITFSVEFLRTIIPAYADLVSVIVQRLSDADVLNSFQEVLSGAATLRFYENVGQLGKHESTVRLNDLNHQGMNLQRLGSTPFQTTTNRLLRDIVTSNVSGDVSLASATGFGGARARQPGTATTSTIEGDLAVLWPNQAGSGVSIFGVYEFTSLAGQNSGFINSVPPLSDPTTFAITAPDATTFSYGSSLVGGIIRRSTNPIMRAENGSIAAGIPVLFSATSDFINDGVQIGDLLIIESGANAGSYLVQNTVIQTSPPDLTGTGTVQLATTTLAFVNLDGTVPSPTLQVDILFRIVRRRFRKKIWEPVQVINDSSVMRIEVLDFGQSPETPFDVFTPDMVGDTVSISNAENSANDGTWTISAYEHPGRVSVTGIGPNTSDASAQAVLNLLGMDYDLSTISDLGIEEEFSATVV